MNGERYAPGAPALIDHHHTAERFWEKVEIRSDGCWEWQAAIEWGGYGAFHFQGTTKRAHRIAYRLVNGDIPAGEVVKHRCGNKACVCPTHLETGSQSDNVRDRNDYLSIEETRELQIMYEITDMNQNEIAEEYGITQPRVSQIVNSAIRKTKV